MGKGEGNMETMLRMMLNNAEKYPLRLINV